MSCRTADVMEAPGVEGLGIERATDTVSLTEFARINAENWEPADTRVEEYYRRSADRLLASDSPLRFYVARLAGAAVAGVEVCLADAALGIYNLSTRRDHRNFGIGAWLLTRSILVSATETGATRAVLQAAPAATGLYRRIGFAEFGRITELKPVRSV
jgi:GNAT superfamily N-acetyltransferase